MISIARIIFPKAVFYQLLGFLSKLNCSWSWQIHSLKEQQVQLHTGHHGKSSFKQT